MRNAGIAAARQLPITNRAHKAGVVGDRGIGAVLAARDMAAEDCRAAALDCRHHLKLVEADMAGIGLTPGRAMAAEDIRILVLPPLGMKTSPLRFSLRKNDRRTSRALLELALPSLPLPAPPRLSPFFIE